EAGWRLWRQRNKYGRSAPNLLGDRARERPALARRANGRLRSSGRRRVETARGRARESDEPGRSRGPWGGSGPAGRRPPGVRRGRQSHSRPKETPVDSSEIAGRHLGQRGTRAGPGSSGDGSTRRHQQRSGTQRGQTRVREGPRRGGEQLANLPEDSVNSVLCENSVEPRSSIIGVFDA